MFRLSIAAACLFATTAFASAQDISETHLQAAFGTLNAINATDQFDGILPGVAERIKAQLITNNPDIELEILSAVEETALGMVARRGDLEREAALAYAKAFTEADLIAITEFYQSEPGQALLANGSIVTREIGQLAQVWSRGIQRDMLAGVTQVLNDANVREGGVDTSGAAEGAAEAGQTETETAPQ